MRVGVDSGGTFTDVVTESGAITKVPSTPADPGAAVRSGSAMAVGSATVPDLLAHGTTVATNALLEGRLGRVCLYCTEGFTDVVEIGRQDRPSLYDPWSRRPEPLVARSMRLGVLERVGADGSVLRAVDTSTLADPPEGADSVAVCTLHADLEASNESAIAEELRRRGWDVTASHEVSPEFREYERTVTTVLNAALRSVVSSYLRALEPLASEVLVMTSAGSLVGTDRAAELPAGLLLSGPAAGARAAAQVAAACGFEAALGFDMGGTSTDVCLVIDGAPAMAQQQAVAGYPVRLPSLDVHTVGAGGGSIARLDAGGALVVGPESAGAVPGPACYGLGGLAPTVTDANVLCGRIPADAVFSGLGSLDLEAAERAMSSAGVTPEGVIAVVNATMVQALRRVSVQRGIDPSDLALVAFGGAGPLHACALAEELGAAAVVVPAMAGVLSAAGLLSSPRGVELVRSWPDPLEHGGLQEAFAELRSHAAEALGVSEPTSGPSGVADGADIEFQQFLDCRYSGQSHDLRTESVAAFHDDHERTNGYARRGDPVEVTAVRLQARLAAPTTMQELCAESQGAWGQGVLEGPAVVSRDDCTVWVPAGWSGSEGALGALVLRRTGGTS